MDRYFDKLDERWRALPLRKQHQYTLYFFVGIYCLRQVSFAKYGTIPQSRVTIWSLSISKTLSSKKVKVLQDCRTHYQQF